MGKVQILAVLTMDGCLSSELYDKAHQDLCLDRCGLDEIRALTVAVLMKSGRKPFTV